LHKLSWREGVWRKRKDPFFVGDKKGAVAARPRETKEKKTVQCRTKHP